MVFRDYKVQWARYRDRYFRRHVDYKYAFLDFYKDCQYDECLEIYDAFTKKHPRDYEGLYDPLVQNEFYWKHDVYVCLDDKYVDVVIALIFSMSRTTKEDNKDQLLMLLDKAKDINMRYATYPTSLKNRNAQNIEKIIAEIKGTEMPEKEEAPKDDYIEQCDSCIMETPAEEQIVEEQSEEADFLEDFPYAELQKNDLVLLFTGMEENEELCLELAKKMSDLYPSLFNSHSNPGVYEKIYHVKPQEKFEGIRRLYDSIKIRKGMRRDYHGIVCIDLSDWIDYTDELYFDVIMKYLFDHKQHGWKYIFTFGSRLKDECTELIKIVNRFFNLYLCEFLVFHEFNRFKVLLSQSLAETKFKLDDFSDAELKILFSVISNARLKPVQELNTFSVFVKDLCDEQSPETKKGLELLDAYLEKNNTFLQNILDKYEIDGIKSYYAKLKETSKGDQDHGE